MAKYVKCPKCQLNYVKQGESLCKVCSAKEFEQNNHHCEYELCHICNTNMLYGDNTICKHCEYLSKHNDYFDNYE